MVVSCGLPCTERRGEERRGEERRGEERRGDLSFLGCPCSIANFDSYQRFLRNGLA